jgi:hypothetical protein
LQEAIIAAEVLCRTSTNDNLTDAVDPHTLDSRSAAISGSHKLQTPRHITGAGSAIYDCDDCCRFSKCRSV